MYDWVNNCITYSLLTFFIWERQAHSTHLHSFRLSWSKTTISYRVALLWIFVTCGWGLLNLFSISYECMKSRIRSNESSQTEEGPLRNISWKTHSWWSILTHHWTVSICCQALVSDSLIYLRVYSSFSGFAFPDSTVAGQNTLNITTSPNLIIAITFKTKMVVVDSHILEEF